MLKPRQRLALAPAAGAKRGPCLTATAARFRLGTAPRYGRLPQQIQ